jgi:hypothetical protein
MTLTGLTRRISTLFASKKQDDDLPTHYLYAHVNGHVVYPSGGHTYVASMKMPYIHVYDRKTGEEIPDVVWCDARMGVLEKYARDDNGNLIILEAGGPTDLVTETITGKFSIREEGYMRFYGFDNRP